MPRLRISIVQYLNTAPLVYGFTNGPLSGKYDLSFTVPSKCADALRSGAVDVAILPAIEYQRIPGLAVLPDMAIASKNEVRSLLLIARRPIEQVRRLALDRSSRSTQALVKILCAGQWKIAPEFIAMAPDLNAMLAEADAALLIGDPALRLSIELERMATRESDGSFTCRPGSAELPLPAEDELHVYDIVQHWRRMTGLPAVLAFWAARQETITPDVVADFLASRDYGIKLIPEISADAERELQLPRAVLETYLTRNIDYSLDEENCRGLETYFRHAADLGLIPEPRAIEWAPVAIRARAHVR